MTSAASFARMLGARRQGHNWRCACPCGCGYELSLADGEDGTLLAYCFGGCGFDDILAALGEFERFDDDDLVRGTPVRERTAEDNKLRIAGARRIYNEGRSGSLVANYLHECRGITLLPPEPLREHWSCPHRLGFRTKAMVAPIINVGGEQTAVHMTYLAGDGSRKAALPKEFQRETRGIVHGGAIRLAEHDPNRELIIGEGLESTLSAMQILELPGWAAISADNLKSRLELPEAVRRIIVAGDNDLAGIVAAREARRRWTAEGRHVRVAMPTRPGSDFNDVLMMGADNGRSHDARRRLETLDR